MRLKILAAAVLTLLPAGARAEDALLRVRRLAKDLIVEARNHPDDADLQVRVRVAKAILAQGSNIRYASGMKGQVVDGCKVSDCSGYISSTAGLFCKLSGSSADMFRQTKSAGALVGAPRFLDTVFFYAPGTNRVHHVGYHVDGEVYLNMGGKENSLLRVTPYDQNDSAGESDTTWRTQLAGYGDIAKYPRRTDEEIAGIVARSGGEKVIQAGPGVVGGVYISPELVLEASRMDDSGFLDALEREISGMNFDENPVQELPDDVQPPAGFENESLAAPPSARVQGSEAYRQLQSLSL